MRKESRRRAADRGRRARQGGARAGAAPLAASLLALPAVLALGAGPAPADPLPLPGIDFALKADLKRGGGTLDIAHSQGRMRVEVMKPGLPASLVGLIDLKARRMVMRSPTVPSMAVELELPPEYAVGALAGSGLRVGEDKVAGEPCDVWKIDPQLNAAAGPSTACITPDGIALRTEIEIKGVKQQVFEATSLTRAPQDPALFQLPPGVQVVKVPKGKIGAALGLPALGGGGDAPR